MNLKLNFIKEIKFDDTINEIVSISLEHEHTINEHELLGDFIITGEYKMHEVSINKESFEKVLPFCVSIPDNVDLESINVKINDFTYELVDSNTLKVNIEYNVDANKMEDYDNDIRELLEENQEDIKEENQEDIKEENQEDIKEEIKENIKEKDVIIKNSVDTDDTFITYKIHIVSENETVDNICSKYNISSDLLAKYNNIENILLKDKIIIPEINE